MVQCTSLYHLKKHCTGPMDCCTVKLTDGEESIDLNFESCVRFCFKFIVICESQEQIALERITSCINRSKI